MKKRGYLLWLIAIVLVVGLGIWLYGERFSLTTPLRQGTAWLGITLLLLSLFFAPSLFRFSWGRWSNRSADAQALNPQRAESSELLAPSWLESLHQRLRSAHRPFLQGKTPWLLVQGDRLLLSQLLPELTAQHWQITPEAVLIDANAPAPVTGWRRLRGRLIRPADGIVQIATRQSMPTAVLGQQAGELMNRLGWALPMTLLLVDESVEQAAAGNLAVCQLSAQDSEDAHLATTLQGLAQELAQQGTRALEHDRQATFAAHLSQWLESQSNTFAQKLVRIGQMLPLQQNLRSVLFVPASPLTDDDRLQSASIWQLPAEDCRRAARKKLGARPLDWLAWTVSAGCAIWIVGMSISAWHNRQLIDEIGHSGQAVEHSQTQTNALNNLLVLQQQIAQLENRQRHGIPFTRRFGLNQDAVLLTAAWQPYRRAMQRWLVIPSQQKWAGVLQLLNQLPADSLDNATSQAADNGYNALRAYMMVTRDTARTEADFLSTRIKEAMGGGTAQSAQTIQTLSRFYAQHLATHPDWKLNADRDLISAARQTLIGLIGIQQADDAVYQGILTAARAKFPDVSLASLLSGQDIRGLWSVSASLPGVYTKKAWDGYIKAAIDKASNGKGGEADWVLVDARQSNRVQGAIGARLRERYFADYSRAWNTFLNGITWIPAKDVQSSVLQLQVYSDPQHSPVVALMQVINDNAHAGEVERGVGDSLVEQAQKIAGRRVNGRTRQAAQVAKKAGQDKIDEVNDNVNVALQSPLTASFKPLTQLVDAQGNSQSELSLQRYLERVTASRLKLQQIAATADSDTATRQAAQTIFSGKGNELSDGLAYASLVSASLGTEWAGFAQNVFLAPMNSSLYTLMKPAAASLNQMWRNSVVLPWNAEFAGRYPFDVTDNEVSIPALGRYLQPQQGVIANFVSTQLGGLLELHGDQWVPTSSALTFDVNFLNALNQLSRLSSHLYVRGDAGYRFELMPQPTAGLTDYDLLVDGQALHYFNQKPEWQALAWPGDPLRAGTRITWNTENAGLRKTLEMNGRWGFIRLLGKARIERLDNARFLVEWPLPGSTGNASSMRYVLRTEAEQGPIELLKLVNFKMPDKVFVQ